MAAFWGSAQAFHDGLPLDPVGSDLGSVAGIGREVRYFMGHGLGQECLWVFRHQHRIVADDPGLSVSKPSLSSSPPSQVEADLRLWQRDA